MTVGDRIKERRKELNISVDELAVILNKNRATVYRYESDEIENLPITVLEPLANALNTTPAYLMGWDEPKENIVNYNVDSGPYNFLIEINKINQANPALFNRISSYFNAFSRSKLLSEYDNLNEEGKVEAIKRIEELTYIPKYKHTED